jgi:hypothetical protein
MKFFLEPSSSKIEHSKFKLSKVDNITHFNYLKEELISLAYVYPAIEALKVIKQNTIKAIIGHSISFFVKG